MKKNIGAKLYKRKSKLILGGNMLLSKKPEMILPDYWPTYYDKAQDTHVWDLNGKRYLDMMCYVGQNTLGYNNDYVNSKIFNAIKKGNMSSLNCYEEILLTEKLLKIHKWAGMAKYARSGGEANALAIRIARSASKKENIAICGYHGWHDWYLSVNLKNKKNLNNHFLPGLKPDGVPKKTFWNSLSI
jgi:glutamate-1-semialdehyde 2,1-aminomutase